MVRATFDSRAPAGSINFGIGQPSPDLMPVSLFRELSERFLADAEPLDFNYGDKRGDSRFIDALAAFLGRAYGQPAERRSLFLTGGNSQALDLVCERFTEPGDTEYAKLYFLTDRFEKHRDQFERVLEAID